MVWRMDFRRTVRGIGFLGVAVLMAAAAAQARDIRPPLQATITAKSYEAEPPGGPVNVQPINDTVENEQVIQAFYETFDLTGQEVAEKAALIFAFDTEVIWPYQRRSTLTSQHLNSSVNRDPASYSRTDNVDFRVLGDSDRGDIRLPTYKLIVELRQIGRVVWRAEARSSHTNKDPNYVFRRMVPVVLETVNTTLEEETFFLD